MFLNEFKPSQNAIFPLLHLIKRIFIIVYGQLPILIYMKRFHLFFLLRSRSLFSEAPYVAGHELQARPLICGGDHLS